MNFSFVMLAAVMVICIAAASSCLSALLCEKIFRRSFGRFRLVFCVLFLSAAIICVSLLLVFVPLPRGFTRYDAIYYGILFVISFISAFFPRAVAVPVILLYSLYAVICIFTLNAGFDSSRSLYEVSLSPSRCEINGKHVEVDSALFSSEKSEQDVSGIFDDGFLYVQFSAVFPPDALLLPSGLIWLRPDGIGVRSEGASPASYSPGGFFDKYVYRLLSAGERLSGLLAGSASEQSVLRQYFVPLELVQFYPAVYGITPIMEDNNLKFKTDRLF